MVLKQRWLKGLTMMKFENDVEMYGTQTSQLYLKQLDPFENDVEMYGTQTQRISVLQLF